MKQCIILILACLLSCTSGAILPVGEELSINLDETLSFRYGDDFWEIEFLRIEDNRCPSNANCVRLGEVFVDLRINNEELKLCLGCESPFDTPQRAEYLGHTYTLIEVTPYPYIGTDTVQKGKIAKIRID